MSTSNEMFQCKRSEGHAGLGNPGAKARGCCSHSRRLEGPPGAQGRQPRSPLPGRWKAPSHDSAEVRWPPGLASRSRAAGSVPLVWGLRHAVSWTQCPYPGSWEGPAGTGLESGGTWEFGAELSGFNSQSY